MGGDYRLVDAASVEGFGQAGGTDLHATDDVVARRSRDRRVRSLVHGAEAQDSHAVLPGHARTSVK